MLNVKLSIVVAALCGLALTACNKPAATPGNPNAPQAQNANAPVPPRLIKGVRAGFPKELWNKPGVVVVAARVGTDGKVNEAKVLSSPHPELNQLAIDSVKQWEFEPARQADKPVPANISVSVAFQPPAQGMPGENPAVPPKPQK